ncbi:NlpC/P60 family protein [Breoghania sp. L-A4]|uniref:C40 family peptidase n=1 Tax=Breoghania sp. L-A4 TaxID=2304600 RepID=UPI000E35896C|nr:NlpC/P60 family protein [Breoghania sp. L-A4]AXS39092.1 glycoside hydrolase [Breoghania sp. L-A4]
MLDRRVTAWRPDLAAAHLQGQVEAARFVAGEPRRVAAPIVPLRREPRAELSIETELLFGEAVTLYETAGGWAWVQAETDGYVGWLQADALAPSDTAPTHKIMTLRSFLYPGADLRFPARGCLSMQSQVTVVGESETRGTRYALLADGSAMIANHLAPLDQTAPDWVAVAEEFLGTPYLWGGRSSLGLDCSALVQLALAASGIKAPRDSDMQQRDLGEALDISGGLPALLRGDLLFWKGHVGIMSDAATLLHANGNTMTVAREPVAAAIARIAALEFGAMTAIKRLS